ncbi:hypothetical protein CCAX7_38940 [Capsulimonas corticalis]|uniref:Uncharacterized protein n=1 Tax=Capsulimonas corticalis TaxID=2219043 RepID=A0A402D3Q5_9BACT|nr:DUF3006 domain-containing protein [Capsulimonas corticalis]BDI31843.1 hypothetical protein CCAX7_38940 [Capsulimonas corticalis]
MTQKRFFLDRIEGDFAVLIPEGGKEEQNVPRADLPAGIPEGAWLIWRSASKTFHVDETETKKAKDDVQSLIDELAGG